MADPPSHHTGRRQINRPRDRKALVGGPVRAGDPGSLGGDPHGRGPEDLLQLGAQRRRRRDLEASPSRSVRGPADGLEVEHDLATRPGGSRGGA